MAHEPHAQRCIIIFSEDTQSMEDLTHALTYLKHGAYKPTPPGERYGSEQEKYSDEEIEAFALSLMRKAAPKLSFNGSTIVP